MSETSTQFRLPAPASAKLAAPGCEFLGEDELFGCQSSDFPQVPACSDTFEVDLQHRLQGAATRELARKRRSEISFSNPWHIERKDSGVPSCPTGQGSQANHKGSQDGKARHGSRNFPTDAMLSHSASCISGQVASLDDADLVPFGRESPLPFRSEDINDHLREELAEVQKENELLRIAEITVEAEQRDMRERLFDQLLRLCAKVASKQIEEAELKQTIGDLEQELQASSRPRRRS